MADNSEILRMVENIDEKLTKVKDEMLTRGEYNTKTELQYYKTLENLNELFIRKENVRSIICDELDNRSNNKLKWWQDRTSLITAFIGLIFLINQLKELFAGMIKGGH